MNEQLYKNCWSLTGFYLKRDLLSTLVWFSVIIGLVVAVAAAYGEIMPDEQSKLAMVETLENPAMIALVGPSYAKENPTTGAMYCHEMLLFTAITVAVMSILLVIRHTRKDEEEGRLEVIRSFPVGRLSTLTATLIVCIIINATLAILTGISLTLVGMEGMGFLESMLFGVTLGITGIVFGTIAAVFSQLSSTSRGALGLSLMALGVLYIVRAFGDISSEIVACLSPLGLIMRTAISVQNQWWPIAIILGLSTILITISFHYNAIRDLGAGLISAKRGKNHASPSLLSPFGLALKLLKPLIIGWGVTMLILGLTYGSIFGDVEKFVSSNELIQQMFAASGSTLSMSEQFMSVIMVIMGIATTIPVIMAILRARKEETSGRLEHIVSRNVSRATVLGSYLGVALITSIILTALSGIGLWMAQLAVLPNPISFITVISSSMVYLPAIWVFIGIAVFLVGYSPKAVHTIWIYVGFSFVTCYFKDLLKIPNWVAQIGPFGNISKLPVDNFDLVPFLLLIGISIVLIIIGFIGYKRRDIVN